MSSPKPRVEQQQALSDLETAQNGIASGLLIIPVAGAAIPALQGELEFGIALFFKAVRGLWKCFELVKDATSLEELDRARERRLAP